MLSTMPTTDSQLGPAGSGPNGEKALQAERDARKQLESDFGQFKAGLASLLGLEKDAKSSTDDVLATVQQQLATMQHDNLVLSVANSHQITDADDLALLRSITDETALRKLAARLQAIGQPGTPGASTEAPPPADRRGGDSQSAGPEFSSRGSSWSPSGTSTTGGRS